jgi:ribonuclease-3
MTRGQLEEDIGYKFANPRLLARALTHRSWAHEHTGEERPLDNERLEFIGDSVLGLAIAEYLFRRNPKMDEGRLTLMKHRLVSTTTLASLSEKLGVGSVLQVGRGEEKTGGRTKPAILADTLEAVIGAIFLDAGYNTVSGVIRDLFAEELDKATPESSLDYKTLLQETLQARKLSAPQYELTNTEGMPHERTFHVRATWENGESTGVGSSRKSAEMMAACEALKTLGALSDDDG